MKYCHWLLQVPTSEADLWGQEAVDLAVAARSGASIAPGFVIGREVQTAFFVDPALKAKIVQATKELSVKHPVHFSGVAKEVRQLILKAKVEPFSKEVAYYFAELKTLLLKRKDLALRIVVRSGRLKLVEEIAEPKDMVKLVQKLYALAFEERELYLRLKRGEAIVPEPLAVIVQYQEKPEFSGTAYAHDPLAHDDEIIQIQANHLQQSVPEFRVEDVYRLDRKSLMLLSRDIQKKWWSEDGLGKHNSPTHFGKTNQTLSDEQATQLARQIKMAQSKFEAVMHFEWVYANKQFLITGAELYREVKDTKASVTMRPKPLLLGMSGGLGFVCAPVRLIKKQADRAKLKDGEIAVVEQLKPTDYQWLAGAGGLISESGNINGNEVATAKLLGVPAVVASGQALTTFKNGQIVSLDGTHGAVYAGMVDTSEDLELAFDSALAVTGTKICATVSDPHDIQSENLKKTDGIGLLRTEKLIKMLATHPQDIVRKKLDQEYVELLAETIEKSLRAVYPRRVIYQLDDLKPEDMLGMRARHHDRYEPNPVIGYRGLHRLLSEPEVLDLELRALEILAKKELCNYSVLLPMVRSLDEVKRAIHYIQNSPHTKEYCPEIWVKCETPAMVIQIEALCQLEIEGVCFDVPALSQLLVGFDQANYQVSHHLDQADQAVKESLGYAITTCREAGVASLITAEEQVLRPEVIQIAVEAGVTAISVLPDQVEEAHGLVASIERKIILDHLLTEEE